MKLFPWLAALLVAVPAGAVTWLPVSQEDLKMTSEAKAPKAPAIYLYRQVDRDDSGDAHELIYSRIKILTEEGRKFADVEIPYSKNENIQDIEARTIRPDGTPIEFDGTIYDKTLVKARGVLLQAKTFTLPNVEVGSIIEYRYRHFFRHGFVFDSLWMLSDRLFTRHASFSLKPYEQFTLRWSSPMGLPPGTTGPEKKGSAIRLETRDVPAFVTEEYMPPEDVMKFRVDFIYEEGRSSADFDQYWRDYGKRRFRQVQGFVNDRRAMEQAVAQIVQPGDAPEAKLRKLYARTQQLRNLGFDKDRSEQEVNRENLADKGSAADVWSRGYGSGIQLTWLFLALTRAAGFEADGVLVPTRDRYLFNPQQQNPAELNSNAVVVKLEGREIYLDPGVPYTPFGVLPWHETGVKSLRLDKDGGTWVSTPIPSAADSRIERKAALKLSTSGTLEGKVAVTYTGLEAASRRLSQRHRDEKERREFLEQDLRHDVSSGSTIELTNTPDWNGSDAPLVAEFEIRVDGWAASAGRRLLLPVGLFGGSEQHTFEHAARVHPLCFDYPYHHLDDITVELPVGWKVNSMPNPRGKDLGGFVYSASTKESSGRLQLNRDLKMNLVFAAAKNYPAARGFFQTVRAGDEDQVVLLPAIPSAQAQ